MTIHCHFLCVNGSDESPICVQLMEPPEIGSLLFFEGEAHGYRVLDVQYQLRKTGGTHVLVMANIIIERKGDRAIVVEEPHHGR